MSLSLSVYAVTPLLTWPLRAFRRTLTGNSPSALISPRRYSGNRIYFMTIAVNGHHVLMKVTGWMYVMGVAIEQTPDQSWRTGQVSTTTYVHSTCMDTEMSFSCVSLSCCRCVERGEEKGVPLDPSCFAKSSQSQLVLNKPDYKAVLMGQQKLLRNMELVVRPGRLRLTRMQKYSEPVTVQQELKSVGPVVLPPLSRALSHFEFAKSIFIFH